MTHGMCFAAQLAGQRVPVLMHSEQLPVARLPSWLLQDPSIRIRREAMLLLPSVVARPGSLEASWGAVRHAWARDEGAVGTASITMD